MNRRLILFSGFNQRAIVAFIRSLRKNNIDEFSIIAASKEDTILISDYKNKVEYIRTIKQLDLAEILFALDIIKNKYNLDELFIIPSTEALNRFVLSKRDIFDNMGYKIPLVDEKLYESVSDKKSFYEVCSNSGLLVPKNIDYPKLFGNKFVAKPKKYISEDGKIYSPILIMNKSDYIFFDKNYPKEMFDYQEYIEGESFYLLYYFGKNGNVCKYSQKNLVQQSKGKSIIAAKLADLHNSDISSEYECLFKKMNFQGMVMIELRKNRDDYYMIEANPRLWGPSQLTVDSHIHIFEYFLFDLGFIDKVKEEDINIDTVYFWSGGLRRYLLEDEECVWHKNSRNELEKEVKSYYEYDIYNRSDTQSIFLFEKSKN